MDLAIIIVNWNTRDLLEQCLTSVLSCAGATPSFEIIVVDNASADDSAAMVRERFPFVRLVANKVNVGFARGNNQAIPMCTGRYLLLLNPDTLVLPGALEALVRFMDENPSAGAAGARLLNPDGTLQTCCYRAPSLTRELWRLLHLDAIHPYGIYNMADWDVQTSREVDVVQGAALIIRHEIVNQMGLFDEDYFIYSEEVDLCHRLHRRGWRVCWVPESQVVHYGGQSTRQVAAAMFLRLYQGKVLYFRKHHGPRATRWYKVIVGGTALVRLALSPFAWLEPSARREPHRQLAAHYARLLRALPGF